MSKEAMKLALDALEVATTPLAKDRQEVLRAIAALREALAQERSSDEQPAQTDWESVAADQAMTIALLKVQLDGLPGKEQLPWNKRPWQQIECPVCGELAKAEPPRRPWAELNHEDIHALMNEFFYSGMQPSAAHFANFARAIEAKLKEKNT